MRERCSATKRDGSQCNAKAVRGKRVCRVHGGLSPGGKPGNQSARKHGIYGRHLTDEEIDAFPDLDAKIGTLDEEIRLCRVRINRALAAENKAWELDDNGLEVVKHHDREASEYTAGDETVKERVDYGAHIERLLKRLESLEKTRSELLKADRENELGDDDGPITEFEVHVVTAENVDQYRDDEEDDG